MHVGFYFVLESEIFLRKQLMQLIQFVLFSLLVDSNTINFLYLTEKWSTIQGQAQFSSYSLNLSLYEYFHFLHIRTRTVFQQQGTKKHVCLIYFAHFFKRFEKVFIEFYKASHKYGNKIQEEMKLSDLRNQIVVSSNKQPMVVKNLFFIQSLKLFFSIKKPSFIYFTPLHAYSKQLD